MREVPLHPLAYRLRWRPQAVLPGAHPGRGEGSEGEFRRHVSLLRQPDPRRIDFRASLRDPFGNLHVRQFSPRRAVPVAALVDLSGSMRFGAAVVGRVAELCAVVALSAIRAGDSFALFGCDAHLRDDVSLPLARRRGMEQEVRQRLLDACPAGSGAGGLVEAAERLPTRRSLVFLISDFLMPMSEILRLLDALWRHEVVPVIVGDSAVGGRLPRWGLMELADLETGARSLVFMRPSLRERWLAEARVRRQMLDDAFIERGLSSFELEDAFDEEAFARRLMEA